MKPNEPPWERKPSSIPAIEVRVWMKGTDYGGRNYPFSARYCPHLVAKGKETMWGIRVLAVTRSPHKEEVFPGDEAELVCELMYYHKGFEYEDLKRGSTFEIREGSRVIGTGVVLSDFEW